MALWLLSFTANRIDGAAPKDTGLEEALASAI